MSDSFKALVLNQEGENFNREIKSIDKILSLTLSEDWIDLARNIKQILLLNYLLFALSHVFQELF